MSAADQHIVDELTRGGGNLVLGKALLWLIYALRVVKQQTIDCPTEFQEQDSKRDK